VYRIQWAENPLASKVFLTERGRYYLRYKIALDGILDAAVLINMDKTMDPPKNAVKWVDGFDYTSEDGQAERRVEELAAQCEHWLSTEVHCGDCTCVPCGCIKCYAEGFLGISTIEGLGKHQGHYVEKAFSGIYSLSNAIQYLLTKPIQATWGKPEDWQQYVPRWTEERNAAVAWLQQYGKEHNFIAVAE
jgi:hypothetical protein